MAAMKPVSCNVVVVAKQFNPSVFSQLWLVKSKVANENELENIENMFTEQVTKVEALSFGLLVVPMQLQFEPRTSENEQAALVTEKVSRIVRLIPHTPFVAVGLNFSFDIIPTGEHLRDFTRRLFAVSESPLYSESQDDDSAMYGGYLSKDIGECRLRLDAKPTPEIDDQNPLRLRLAFNYQRDVANNDGGDNDPVGLIEKHIARWDELKAESIRIVTIATNA